MPQILNYSPGQRVTIILQVLDATFIRADSPITPTVFRIISPSLTLLVGYPAVFTKLDTGLYSYSFTLPAGAAAVGTFIVDYFWQSPDDNSNRQDYVQVNVTAPLGAYTASPG